MAPSHRITFTPADGTQPHVVEVRMASHLNSPTVYHDADPHARADSWCWERPYSPRCLCSSSERIIVTLPRHI